MFDGPQVQKRAEVTLASIGDAVITTDANGIVQYLNPVAESLSGWSISEARGRSLGAVLQVLDEQTREAAPSALEQCLEEGAVVGLAERSLLISRSGKEIGIKAFASHGRGGMGIKTIAEHADSSVVVEELREVGVAYAQGEIFGSPRPLKETVHDSATLK